MNGVEYKPAPICAKLIKSEKFYNFIIGPVGSAKTTAILFKILYHACRQEPSPIDGIRHTRFVIVRNTLAQLKDTTINSFFTWFKPGQAGNYEVSGTKFTFKFSDVECEVLFRPLDSPDDVRRVLSLEVTGAVIDEFVEIPQEIIEALSGRCGRYPSKKDGGATWWGMWGASNPGNEDSWWYDWLYDEWSEEEGGPEAKADTLGYFEQPSGFSPEAENIENLPGGRDYYTNLAFGKTPEWAKQFIEVEWGYSLRGTPVYKMFNPDIHIAKTPLKYQVHLPILIGFDAGLTPAAIFAQHDIHGRLLVLAEIIGKNIGAKRFARTQLIPYMEQNCPPGAEYTMFVDPAATGRAQSDESKVIDVLRNELKIPVAPASTNVLSARIDAVEYFLMQLTEAGPAMLVDQRCQTLIRGYRSGYRYGINRKGAQSSKPEKDEYSHSHDANQYLCLGARRNVYAAEARRKRPPMAMQRRAGYAWS